MTDWIDTDGDGVGNIGKNDANGDRIADSYTVDINGNHVIDSFAIDADQNGIAETIWFDQNEDGYIDAYAADSNQDGVADSFGVDPEQDGVFVAPPPEVYTGPVDYAQPAPTTTDPSEQVVVNTLNNAMARDIALTQAQTHENVADFDFDNSGDIGDRGF